MHLTSQCHPARTRIYAGFMAAGLCVVGLSACGGANSGYESYTPSAQVVSEQPARDAKSPIHSTCGTHIHIVVAGFVDCKFREKGYGGNFSVLNHTKGLVSISPNKGTKDTTFTVTGVLAGRGYFLVRDRHKNELTVKVRVTL